MLSFTRKRLVVLSVFTLCLVIAAAARFGPVSMADAEAAAGIAAPFAGGPVIVATLTDNIPAATKVPPGGTINYTAVVTNNGLVAGVDDATNLVFTDTLDANTTLV